jgi:hypothetical protein
MSKDAKLGSDWLKHADFYYGYGKNGHNVFEQTKPDDEYDMTIGERYAFAAYHRGTHN